MMAVTSFRHKHGGIYGDQTLWQIWQQNVGATVDSICRCDRRSWPRRTFSIILHSPPPPLACPFHQAADPPVLPPSLAPCCSDVLKHVPDGDRCSECMYTFTPRTHPLPARPAGCPSAPLRCSSRARAIYKLALATAAQMPGKLSLAAARRREGRLAAGFPRSVMADRLEPGEQSARHGGAVDAPHVMLAAWLPPTHARLVHVVIPERSIKARSRNSTTRGRFSYVVESHFTISDTSVHLLPSDKHVDGHRGLEISSTPSVTLIKQPDQGRNMNGVNAQSFA